MAASDPADPASASAWTACRASWTAWDRVRTVATLLAAALLTVSVAA